MSDFRRAMTMIELLVTLIVLSGVMVAVATWTRTAATLTVHTARTVGDRSAFDAVLRLIGDDIACGDFALSDRARRAPMRVEVDDGALVIRTRETDAHRGAGPATHRFQRDPNTRMLRLESVAADRSRRGTRMTRDLVGGVRSFSCTLVEHDEGVADDDIEHSTLEVILTSDAGTVARRRYDVR